MTASAGALQRSAAPLAVVPRWSAMFAAWMLLWILFALLQRWLDRFEDVTTALLRGAVAALCSGVAFYLISGIWTDEHGVPNPIVRLGYWAFAFVPGFVALFFRRWPK